MVLAAPGPLLTPGVAGGGGWCWCGAASQFLSAGAGTVWGGGVLLFILGSSLGGVGPERGLRGGGRRGWCEEWARIG